MIEINNLTTTPFEERFLNKVARKVLKGERKNKLELSIALVKLKRIKELNKKYRKKNRPTDVLSFLYSDSGEIIICPEIIEKNAGKFKTTFKKELIRVLIHGILHILGYNHGKSVRKAKKMEKKKIII